MARAKPTAVPLAELPGLDVGKLARYWDANVLSRAAELELGDAAYERLKVLIEAELEPLVPAGSRVLDAGCGLGYLAGALSSAGYAVDGIDVSEASIGYATRRFVSVTFAAAAIENCVLRASHSFAGICANMVLHTTPRCDRFLRAARRLISRDGVIVITLPHPAFYLQSKDDVSIPTFEYLKETAWLIPFRISGGRTHPSLVPFFHRPIAQYCRALHNAGFRDMSLSEPQDTGGRRSHDLLILTARG